jgi:hypothetical protein
VGDSERQRPSARPFFRIGRRTEGTGQAPSRDQLRLELKTLSIGKLKLGRVAAIRRELSPSLIGAEMLKHFVVTFDSKSETVFFSKCSDNPFVQSSFGFTLAFDKTISVAVVWDNSPAYNSGLRSGIPLTSINGIETELTKDGIQRTITAMAGQEISLEWRGGSARLRKESRFCQN